MQGSKGSAGEDGANGETGDPGAAGDKGPTVSLLPPPCMPGNFAKMLLSSPQLSINGRNDGETGK